jgi:hypothetical protein
MKHYKGICEVGSLIGAVDDVDMQILPDLDIVRFQVDIRSINKFPMVKEFTVKPWVYDIVFSIEKVVEMGTLEESAVAPMEIDETRGKEKETEERQKARCKKVMWMMRKQDKQKSSSQMKLAH